MEKDIFVKKLKRFGYSDDSIKKILQGKQVPTMAKAFALKDLQRIPLNAWRDIKSYIVNSNSSKSKT